MTAPDVDPEQLAPLLDGRLREPERSALLASLAGGGGLPLLTETAAVLREAERPALGEEA